MNAKYKIMSNKLIADGFMVEFSFDIGQVEFWDGIYIVRLNITDGVHEYDNIYGISTKGEKVWRIENPIKAFGVNGSTQGYEYYAKSIYIGFELNQDGTLIAISFNAMEYVVDCKTGKITKQHGLGQRPW